MSFTKQRRDAIVLLLVLGLGALVASAAARASTITAPATSATGSFTVSWPAGYDLWLNDVSWQVAAAPTRSVTFSSLPAGHYRFVLVACAWTYSWELGYAYSCARVPSSAKTVLVTGGAPPAIDEWTDAAGTMAYRSGVSPRGAAEFAVPLRTPAGVSGVALDLSLAYDSARAGDRDRYVVDDLLGYGWHLRGIPYIHRCRAGQAQDPHLGGVPTLTTSDSLCLDGEPLVLTAGSHWRPDAEYRVAADPDKKVILRSTTAVGLWFEVRYADGSVGRFGDTADSRVLASGQFEFVTHSVAPNEPYFWGLRKLTGAAGGELTVGYQRFDGYGVLQPRVVAYGGAEVYFSYGARADLAPLNLDWSTQVRRLSVLNSVEVRMNGKPVREYRLANAVDADGRVRLERVQECGYDSQGSMASCLQPLRIQWVKLATSTAGYPIAISEVVDGLGARTGFSYVLVKPDANPLGYAEAPFGTTMAIVDTQPTSFVAVSEHRVSDGRAAGALRRWHHGYKGAPLQSARSRGFLGFAEVRSTDAQSGIVRYSQRRLDWPFLGALSQQRSFDAPFGAHTLEIAREEHAYAQKVHANGARHAYLARSTRWLLEGSVTVGGVIEQRSFCYRVPSGDTCPATGSEHDFASQQQVVSTIGVALSNPAFKPAFWGDVPNRSIAAQNVRRTVTEVAALSNTTTPWVRGAAVRRTVTHAVPGQPARSVRENVSYLAGTRIVGSSVQFPGDPRLERSLTRSFDPASGNLLSAETVQGASLAARTWRYATPYQDSRYVAEITNPLGHTLGRTTDDRFGQPMRIVDPDGRSTIVEYDPFGRVVREVRPDGTEVATRYERCDQADCGAVADAEPGIRVTVSTHAGSVQAAPTRVTYLDVLGREVLQEIEMLDPAQGWRGQRTGYDRQGRVQYVTRPVVGSAPPVCTAASRDCRWLTWDLVDRIVREDRPDGGVTTTTFSPASGRVTVSRTETVKTPGLSNTSRTQRSIFDVLGQVTETRDAVGSSVGTTTAYTYDAHGNLATVTVAGTRVATLEHDLAGNRTRLFDASSGSTEFAYNALGEVIRSTDAKGQVTHYEYDLLGRLVRRIDAGGITHAWQWDATHATGRLASRSRPGFAEAYAYDADYGRLARVDTQVNVSGVWTGAQSRELGYDAAGRLATQRFPNGQVVGYDYSSTGHLQRVTSGATVLHDWRATDAFGSPVEERFHNGALRTARSYDPANGLLTSVRTGTSLAPGAIQDLETAWRTNRTLYRRIDRRNTTSTMDDYVDTIGYDAVDRVVRQATSSGALRVLDFSYAANGNLTRRSSTTPGDAIARDFVHGHPAQPYRLTGVTLGGIANTLAYDANGNVIRYSPSSGPLTWLRYDARNNVTRITIGHDEAIGEARDEFWYDPDGHRFLSRETWDEGGVSMSRSVLYLGADYEESRSPAGADHDVVQRIQVSPAARIVRRRHAETGAWTVAHEYLHRDHLGSVETVTNGAGVVLARYSFDPFGTHRATHRASDLRADGFAALLGLEVTLGARGFTGHEHRNRTGFIHMNGRVYDPRIGRFVSPDPMVQAPWTGQGFNRYAYVMNGPLSYVDPTGRCGTETGFQLTPCRGFDEHVRVIGAGIGGGGFFGSLDPEGGGFGIQVPGGIGGIGGIGAGGFLADVEALLKDFLADRQAQAEETPADRQATEVVSVTADRPAGQDRDDVAGGWILRVLENLDGVGIRSLFGSGCAGIILGGCGAISVDSSTGAVHAMFMLGVIPGAGFSVGSEATLFSSDFQSSSGYGTALFATGGASGIGGSLGIAQGTNGFSVTGAAGYGFGFGGGLGFYYAMPVGSLAK